MVSLVCLHTLHDTRVPSRAARPAELSSVPSLTLPLISKRALLLPCEAQCVPHTFDVLDLDLEVDDAFGLEGHALACHADVASDCVVDLVLKAHRLHISERE